MSVAFSSARPRSKSEVTQQAIQKMLDENHHLIQCIMDCQSKGKTVECTQYQQILHRNLVYLATIADSNQNMQSLLPAPPSSNMSMDPGRMSQSGGHASSNLNDNMGPLPPYMIQGQLSNGPSHALMQSGHMQSAITSASSNTSSVSNYSPATPSSQGSLIQDPWSGYGSSSSSTPSSSSFPRSNLNTHSSQVSMMHQQSAPPQHSSANSGRRHYQGHQSMSMMGQTNQGNNTIPQRPMGPYRPSQQGSAQHYMGQEEFYGEQYGHTQNSTELTNQQYYTDGKNIIHIITLHTVNKVTRGRLVSLHSTTMKEVTLSTANSRAHINRALVSSRLSVKSSTPLSRATAGSHKDMVLAREDHPSFPSISRVRTNSMDLIILPKEDLQDKPKGLSPMNRVSMEICSNEATHCFQV
ncbi:PREDICTED: calcium-responsive transactivator isoform X2 [Cyprinodon variegatus]|uniref:calcium-responsive transactivator isoform X2 n=1 Tax=Cyprinodon variegatus TaxID=28743 RepID=UPI00074284F0|nr:PREDICTED: calcium-responsive transactivator isoform X2 [Cyprinodon variegatus]